MKSITKKISRALLVVPLFALVLGLTAPSVYAADCAPGELSITCGSQAAQGKDQPSSLFGGGGEQGLFQTIVNIMLFIVGAVAVIMLIIGGIRYVTSAGDQTHVTAAKNTILYAIVGIVVAVLAYAVVNFVLGSLVPSS